MPAAPRFPVSDHCDGERFFNPAGAPPRSFLDLPRWWYQQAVLGQREHWPAHLAPPPQQAVPLPSAVPAGQVAITFIGHATFLLQFDGFTVLTDPVFAHRAGPFGVFGPARVRPPALTLEQLPHIDVVLLSHNHYDHLDLAALRTLHARHRPQLVTTLGNRAWLAARGVPGAVELDWWQPHLASPELSIIGTPARHWSSRHPWDRCRTLWGGFMLKTPAGALFFCGDSAWGGHFTDIRVRLGPCGVALLPIGAYLPRWFMEPVHMSPEEAVRAHLALGARRSLAMHFGTFPLADDGPETPLLHLATARAAQDLAPEAFSALDFGETRLLELA